MEGVRGGFIVNGDRAGGDQDNYQLIAASSVRRVTCLMAFVIFRWKMIARHPRRPATKIPFYYKKILLRVALCCYYSTVLLQCIGFFFFSLKKVSLNSCFAPLCVAALVRDGCSRVAGDDGQKLQSLFLKRNNITNPARGSIMCKGNGKGNGVVRKKKKKKKETIKSCFWVWNTPQMCHLAPAGPWNMH